MNSPQQPPLVQDPRSPFVMVLRSAGANRLRRVGCQLAAVRLDDLGFSLIGGLTSIPKAQLPPLRGDKRFKVYRQKKLSQYKLSNLSRHLFTQNRSTLHGIQRPSRRSIYC